MFVAGAADGLIEVCSDNGLLAIGGEAFCENSMGSVSAYGTERG